MDFFDFFFQKKSNVEFFLKNMDRNIIPKKIKSKFSGLKKIKKFQNSGQNLGIILRSQVYHILQFLSGLLVGEIWKFEENLKAVRILWEIFLIRR